MQTKKASWTTLRKRADKEFAHYVRLRDSWYEDGAWVGLCITCERKCLVIDANGRWQKPNGWGHYITRGNYTLRYLEENTNLQCGHCNAWMDKEEMLGRYRKALDLKYGRGTAAKLRRLSKLKPIRPNKQILKEHIESSREYLKYALAHPENYEL